MPSLEAEINRPDRQPAKEGSHRANNAGRQDLGQNIQSREGRRVAHQGQLNELLDRAAPKLYPDPLVFASRFLFCRMRRPFDAQMPEVVETDGNRAVALVESRVQIDAQTRRQSLARLVFAARDESIVKRSSAAASSAGQELAFGSVQFQGEGELMPALPRVVSLTVLAPAMRYLSAEA